MSEYGIRPGAGHRAAEYMQIAGANGGQGDQDDRVPIVLKHGNRPFLQPQLSPALIDQSHHGICHGKRLLYPHHTTDCVKRKGERKKSDENAKKGLHFHEVFVIIIKRSEMSGKIPYRGVEQSGSSSGS